MLGVEQGKVKLEEYNSNWKKEYIKEKNRLEQLIGKYILKIEHVGSTAIPGMKAKPIIDIAVLVDKLDNNNQYTKILKNVGYEYRDDNGEREEHLFKKTNKNKTTHFIHIVEKDGKRWENYKLFKNHLLHNSEEILNYTKLKEQLAVIYKDDRSAYTKHKNDYILKIIEKEKMQNGIE